MRLTLQLCKQHIGKQFKQHWRVQSKRKPSDSGAIKFLTKRGIPIYKPDEILGEPKGPQFVEEPDYIAKPIKFDKTHPNWHDKILYTFKDDNVLLDGLTQAKIITKTVELEEGLPETLSKANITNDIDKKVKKIILNAHLFDSYQDKLPKRKDPLRPAWNFPRDFGITDFRKNDSLTTKLLQLVELISDKKIVKQRSILHDLDFWYPFEKAGDLIQLQLRGDMLLTTSRPLSPITNESTMDVELPSMYPAKHTVTLNTEHIYEIKNLYPIKPVFQKIHPHTVFVHYNPTEVKNIYEEEVTDEQFLGRTLMKAFTVAAAYAKQNSGEDVAVLPKPVTVQCVQTDGCNFHFGVLQLNTLDTADGGVKNVWYHSSKLPLFRSCLYNLGKPTLDGYNGDVIRHLVAFYNNS